MKSRGRVAAAFSRFPTSGKYLVGVSGGRDSMFLLHLLGELGYRKLVVCHLDHRLRGREATRDATFVEREAGRLGLRFLGERCDVAGLAKMEGLSLEAAGREARLRFFGRCAAEARCPRLVLAHHADDRVETFVWNLLRGSGADGLSALPAVREIRVGRRVLTVIRPLAGIFRAEIERAGDAVGLKFREDSSNLSTEFTRNRIRANVLPMLETEAGRPVREALWRAAEILGEEGDLLDALAPVLEPEPAVADLAGVPVALQRRALRRWLDWRLNEAGVREAGFDEVEAVRSLLDVRADGVARINLPGDLRVARRRGRLVVEP